MLPVQRSKLLDLCISLLATESLNFDDLSGREVGPCPRFKFECLPTLGGDRVRLPDLRDGVGCVADISLPSRLKCPQFLAPHAWRITSPW
jgi:hypothetical protein